MNTDHPHNCPTPDALINTTKLNIEKYGLQVIGISATDYLPSFSYSIGLYENYQHPEIICFGLPTDLAYTIINDVANLIKNGKIIALNQEYGDQIFKETRAQFLHVDVKNIEDYFGAALNYYQHDNFPALQLVWADRNNKLPWEDGFEEKLIYDQPLLDRNADFKFREAKNLGIFTTRQWLEHNQAILRVVHDTDGDWQFLTGDQEPDDIRLVALEQMILRDPTLNEVFDLEYNQAAERDVKGGKWKISNLEDYKDI
ncbi:DUF4262 domain-containing protein [Acinetobacter beijerinckii]|uniref:DUF4262 domain-containing protein n=1 Tax=Acinetobacter beijerinckii CIP 110307 TaxID=1217648 RepID=N9EBX1_9GAMM|nr:DUF4262 domain-containing protein [Acinetobacter beijerinckii]ENW07933.1 hypothetical protein F933_00457 [Acinetobacter beijerinckii CIP 110307]